MQRLSAGLAALDNADARVSLVLEIDDVSAVVAGQDSSLALREDGTVWAWGSNTFGQLGDGTTTRAVLPVQVAGLDRVVQIATGSPQGTPVAGGDT